MKNGKILFVVNDDWFFLSHRLPIALKAQKEGYEVHVATGPYVGESKLTSLGFKHHVYSIARAKINPLQDLMTICSLSKLYKNITPDIIHHITIKPVIFGCIAARLANAKSVVNAISGLGVIFIAQGLKAKIKRFLVAKLYRFALGHKNSITIVQNKDDKATIQTLAKLSDDQMVLIKGSGVDLTKFIYTPLLNNKVMLNGELSESENSCKVVLLARMLKDKGVEEFYQAAKQLKEYYPQTKFILAGDTHENPASLGKDKLQAWNDEGIVHWIGHIENTVELIQQVDIVVLPSYREGLPKVLLESQAIGRPIVTTDVPGCRDAIVNQETGILVPVKDAISLAEAISDLINDFDKRKNMGRKGRQLVEKEFSIDLVVSQHMTIYNNLCS